VIPLRDANPTQRRPIVTYALIVACVAVFGVELWIQATQGETGLERFLTDWGAVPSRITENPTGPALLTLITSQFLHAGWIHLGGNMLYLWIFGNNVEDRFGRLGYLVFYLFGGIVAALSQIATSPDSTGPLIGASGAIAAVLGAYLVLYPGARVLSAVFLGFFYQLIQVPAVIVLVLWFALQLLSGFMSLGATAEGGVAFFAHIGGFVLGVIVGAAVRVVRPGPGGGPQRQADPYGVG
jgi:membrane associated rhomboid family serine protease